MVIFKEIWKEKLKQIIALSPVKIINKLRQYWDDELRVILSDIDIILMVFNDNDSNSLWNITKDYFMKISEEIIWEYKNNVKKPLKQVIKKYINKKRFFREEFNIKKQIEIIIKLFWSEKHEMLELIKNIYSKTYSPKIKETIYEFLKWKFITEEIEYMTTNIDNELINKKFSLDDINNILLKSWVKIIEIVWEFSNYNDFFTKKREPGKNLALSLIYNKIKKEPIYMYIKWEKIEEALYNYLKNDSSSEICSIVILPILEELKSKKEKKQYLNNRFVPK